MALLGSQQGDNRQILHSGEVIYVTARRNAAADSYAAESVQRLADKGDIAGSGLPPVYRDKERMSFGV